MDREEPTKIRFTDEQQKIIGDEIRKRLKNYQCVLCNNNTWSLEPFMVPLSVSNDISVRLGGEILPLIPITCSNCGNTHFLNLVTLGLLDVVKNNKEDKK